MEDKMTERDRFDDTIAELYSEVANKGYHPQKKYIAELLKLIPSGKSVLELGCETGDILIPLYENGRECYGLDKSSAMLYQLLRRNGRVKTFLSDVRDFNPCGVYDYVFSCNGVFSIKGDELESYILDENELKSVLKKYEGFSHNGILINKGTEKPGLRIRLNGREYVHEEKRNGDIIEMTHLLYDDEQLVGRKEHVKKRYPLKRVFKGAKVKDNPDSSFVQVFRGIK